MGRHLAMAGRCALACVVSALACVPMPASAATSSPTTGDAARGELLYARCMACHALASDRVGPRHCGLFGRRAGSVPGYAYSAAMKRAGVVWNEATLDRFLTRPLKMVPGSAMTYDGVADAGERADLIAFLKQVDRTAACAR